jgi:hypothetical protein
MDHPEAALTLAGDPTDRGSPLGMTTDSRARRILPATQATGAQWNSSQPSFQPVQPATSRARAKQGLLLYLALWAIVFPIQTVVVFSISSDGSDVL